MRYVIDGYNLLFRLLSPDEKIDQYRESLIKILARQAEEKKFDLTIVFDAHQRKEAGYRTHKGKLEVIYSDQGQTADAYILENLLLPDTIVVTSDKHLGRHVKNAGCKTLSNDKFIKLIKPAKANRDDKPTNLLHDRLFEYYLNAFESNIE